MRTVLRWLLLPLLFCIGAARAQDAKPEAQNEVNSKTNPAGSMMADSPVTFPERGALPSAFPPDVKTDRFVPEPDYSISGSPKRSLEQIREIRKAMPEGRCTPPPTDWQPLSRARNALKNGGEIHILGLGDSIVNDTFRSGWLALLRERYPEAKIRGTVYVRGGGGCKHYWLEDRVATHLVPLQPDLVFIGGISQNRDYEAIRSTIDQIREGLPECEIILATGTFGTVDPRREDLLAAAPHSGSSDYGIELKKIAREKHCAYLDMTTPWAEYIRSSGKHPHLFYRDRVHANAEGEQILAKILLSFLDVDRD